MCSFKQLSGSRAYIIALIDFPTYGISQQLPYLHPYRARSSGDGNFLLKDLKDLALLKEVMGFNQAVLITDTRF